MNISGRAAGGKRVKAAWVQDLAQKPIQQGSWGSRTHRVREACRGVVPWGCGPLAVACWAHVLRSCSSGEQQHKARPMERETRGGTSALNGVQGTAAGHAAGALLPPAL